jgi:hypothetical protein
VVNSNQKVHYQKVVIGRDYGNQLDIISGLEPGTAVIVNVADGLQEGAQVHAQVTQTVKQPGNTPPAKQASKQSGS